MSSLSDPPPSHVLHATRCLPPVPPDLPPLPLSLPPVAAQHGARGVGSGNAVTSG